MLIPLKKPMWPSGDYRDVATIEVSDSRIVENTSLPLVSGVEAGLGTWVAVGGKTDSGLNVEIIKFLDSPEPDVFMVRIDKSQDPRKALEEIFRELKLESSCVRWRSF